MKYNLSPWWSVIGCVIMTSWFTRSIHAHKPTALTMHNGDDNQIQHMPGLTLRHSHMLTMPFTLFLPSDTHVLFLFFLFLANCKKQYRETMSSHGSYPPSGHPPTSSSLWSIWWVYLLFIRTGGQHRWDTKSLNPCMPMKGEMWSSILYLYVFCWPFGAPIKE